MAEQNFRVQFLRGTTAENDAYVGRDGEITIDSDQQRIRLHDGATAGGHPLGGDGGGGVASPSVTIQVESWANNQYVLPSGVTVEKEYSDSSLKITHGKGKFPTGWFGFSREGSPMTGITATSTRNIQILDENTVIITNLSSFEVFDLTLNFS